LRAAENRRVISLRRLGKRIVFCLEGEIFLLIHLMVAGRLRWRPPGTGIPGRVGLAAFDFPAGTLLVTEAGTKKRASMHLAQGESALKGFDPGGLEVLEADLETFTQALHSESHTLKRALSDPRIFSGIGNAYSDEILHAARLSPLRRTDQMSAEETRRLFEAVRSTLAYWTSRLRQEAGSDFPEKVTAFREGMKTHGRYRQPCTDCGAPIQRIVYAEKETNYCPECQTGGRILADRSLSRLLRADWPQTVEELEELYRK
jgi:formamidopyrimidine-DNA glycosylase